MISLMIQFNESKDADAFFASPIMHQMLKDYTVAIHRNNDNVAIERLSEELERLTRDIAKAYGGHVEMSTY